MKKRPHQPNPKPQLVIKTKRTVNRVVDRVGEGWDVPPSAGPGGEAESERGGGRVSCFGMKWRDNGGDGGDVLRERGQRLLWKDLEARGATRVGERMVLKLIGGPCSFF